jgi:kynureninase
MPDRRQADEAEARALDARNPLARFREQFLMPPGSVYLMGNSLGPLCWPAERTLERALEQWRRLGVAGWLEAEPPWISLAETMGEAVAPLVGAAADEVVATGTTTVNIHALVGTLHAPEGRRTRILADELNFPSDIYALGGQLLLKGLDPDEHLVLVRSRDGRTLDEEEIIAAMTDEVALVHLPSVVYRSGQLLDMERLAAAAAERGIPIGFDCCHSVGVLPHRLDDWQVDYATWCSYKYLNGGPGSTAFLYLNRKHFERSPLLRGWFGYVKEKQFEMRLEFEHARSAGGWQISSPAILSSAPVLGSLALIAEAGIEAVRRVSLEMTSYLIDLVDRMDGGPFGVEVGTPRDPGRRGGHVALEVNRDVEVLREALARAGVIVDFRPPNVIRMAPCALYNTFHELWRVAGIIGAARPHEGRGGRAGSA